MILVFIFYFCQTFSLTQLAICGAGVDVNMTSSALRRASGRSSRSLFNRQLFDSAILKFDFKYSLSVSLHSWRITINFLYAMSQNGPTNSRSTNFTSVSCSLPSAFWIGHGNFFRILHSDISVIFWVIFMQVKGIL